MRNIRIFIRSVNLKKTGKKSDILIEKYTNLLSLTVSKIAYRYFYDDIIILSDQTFHLSQLTTEEIWHRKECEIQ